MYRRISALLLCACEGVSIAGYQDHGCDYVADHGDDGAVAAIDVGDEGDHLAGQNESHDNGSDDGDADTVEHGEEAGLIAVDLFKDILGLELDCDHNCHEHCTKRHCQTLRPEVHEVKPAIHEYGAAHHVFAKQGGRVDAVGAKAAVCNQQSLDGDCDADPDGDLGTVDLLALFCCVVQHQSGNNFHRR